jgi:hypothetical protein
VNIEVLERMGAAEPFDTGFSHLLAESTMRHPLTVVARIVAAGAAVFALLGACGRPPTAPSNAGNEAIVGIWEGSIGADAATLTIALAGDEPDGSVTVAGATYPTDRGLQSRVTSRENVILIFRASNATLHLVGSVSQDGRRFSGTASGPWAANRPFAFTKR